VRGKELKKKPAQAFVQIFPWGSSVFEQLLGRHKPASEPSQAWIVWCILISGVLFLLLVVLIWVLHMTSRFPYWK